MNKLILGALVSSLFFSCKDKAEEKPVTTEATLSTADTKKPPTEVLDLSEADVVKAGSQALANKDIAGITANYADDVRYFWSGGDSAIGKKAVMDYWTGRMNIIDSINFSETVLLPIRINESQSPKYATVGKWVLAWNFSHVKYKNGKTIHFWVHTDYHFNDEGKINTVVQYIDRVPIMEATKGL